MAADTIVTGSKLTAIADAIRAKLGTQATYTLDQMAAAVASISGQDRLVNRIVAESAGSSFDYDLAGSDFPAQGIADAAFLLDRHIRDVTLPADNAGLTQLRASMFEGSSLRSLVVPARTDGRSWSMGMSTINGTVYNWFRNCTRLQHADLSPVATFTRNGLMESRMFCNCQCLTTLLLPTAATWAVKAGDFESCASLASLVVPDGAALAAGDAARVFYGCHSMATLDLGTGVAALNGDQGGNASMVDCECMERVILRKADGIVALSSPGYLFTSMARNVVPDGLDGFYVPDALVATYKADAVWSLWTDYIKPISGLGS